MGDKNEDLVICVYDDNLPSVSDRILEAFERYLKSTLQKEENL